MKKNNLVWLLLLWVLFSALPYLLMPYLKTFPPDFTRRLKVNPDGTTERVWSANKEWEKN